MVLITTFVRIVNGAALRQCVVLWLTWLDAPCTIAASLISVFHLIAGSLHIHTKIYMCLVFGLKDAVRLKHN